MNIKAACASLLGLLALGGPRLFAATLLRTDFEAETWAGKAAYASNGLVTAAITYGDFGTIDTYGSSNASKGLLLSVNSSGATGAWTAGFTSGILSLTTTNADVTNLGLVTLSFSLAASAVHPVAVTVESFNSTNARTGGLRTLLHPATTNYHQRFAIDLASMTASGAGSFDPRSPKIAVSFELDSAAGGNGWPDAAGLALKIDNLNFATPKFYVKTNGVNSNTAGAGTTEATAYATPAFAVGKTGDGDIIVVRSGTYVGAVSFGANAGAPDAWIVLKNFPGENPVIRYAIWNAISIGAGSSGSTNAGAPPAYLEVRGLTVRGYSGLDANGDRFLDPTLADKIGLAVGESNGNGISVDGRYMTQLPHHFRFADNVVEFNSGGGLSWIRADRVQVENNIVRNNAWWMIYGGSGMSTLLITDFEDNAECRTLIQGNQTYGNETMVPWFTDPPRFSDGNGLILDTHDNYHGRTLVQNNLSFNNGGSGIHAYKYRHADIVHNTVYDNSASPKLTYGQLHAGSSDDVRMLNNIIVAPTNLTGSAAFNESVTSNSGNTPGTILFQNNLYWGGQTAIPTALGFTNNLQADPQFISPSIDPANASFRLRSGSPARSNAPALDYRSGLDLAGRPRPSGVSDQGAYQIQTGDCFPPVFSPLPGNYFASPQTVTLASATAGAKIIFTTNGTMPTVCNDGTITNGFEYVGPGLQLSSATTLKAVAWKSNLVTSAVTGGAYTFLDRLSVPIPDLFFVRGDIKANGKLSVAAICRTPGALLRYTLDGSKPSPVAGTLAGSALIDLNGDETLRAIAYLPGRANSAVADLYGFSLFTNAAPAAGTQTNAANREVGNKFRSDVKGKITALRVWCPAGGDTNFSARLWKAEGAGAGTSLGTVTIQAATPNAWAGARLSTPVDILADTTYLVSYSVASNFAYQAVANGLGSARTNGPLYFPAGTNGVFATTLGTYPTQDSGGVDYGADVFMITSPAASPSFSPAPGNYVGAQTITLTSATTNAVIRYTTNGTAPGPASPAVTNGGTVNLADSATLKAVAVAPDLLDSFVTSGDYALNLFRAPAITLLTPTNDAATAIGAFAVTAAVSDPDNNVALVEYFFDGAKQGQTFAPPHSLAMILPGGYHSIFARVTDTDGLSAVSATAFLTVTGAVTSIAAGAAWRYWDSTNYPGDAWRTLAFNDSAWSNGAARLGYGGDGEVTQVTSNRMRITTYFRRAFSVTNPELFTNFTLRLVRDDAAVVWLNGAEIWRSNLPATGAILPGTFATNAVAGAEEQAWFTNQTSAALLRAGTNLVAVEVHQNGTNSSDLGFDFALAGNISPAPPALNLSRADALFTFTWPDWAGGLALHATTNLAPPVIWSPVTNASVLTNNQFRLTLTAPTNGTRFFRLQRPANNP